MGVLLPSADTEELERAMTTLFDRFGGMGVAELRAIDQREMERFAREFGETVRSLPFQLPESFLLLIRTISLISGVTSALNRDFNMWDAVDPFARTVLSGGAAGFVRDLPQQALGFATTLVRLPGRVDELASRLERGQVAVRTPDLDRRVRSLDRSVSRLVSAVVFAGLLVAGVMLRPTDAVLSWVLMGAALRTVPVTGAHPSGHDRSQGARRRRPPYRFGAGTAKPRAAQASCRATSRRSCGTCFTLPATSAMSTSSTR